MILRKETETSYNIYRTYNCTDRIRMNDTPQGDGNFRACKLTYSSCFINKNE